MMSDTKTAPKNLPTLHAERDPDYVYVVYIRASQDAVWAALTDNKADRSWWVGTGSQGAEESQGVSISLGPPDRARQP